MWSCNVYNVLNSSMKLAVLQQTSNTLIIDGSLLGAATLYHSANKTKKRVRKEASDTEGSGEQRRSTALHFFSSELKKEDKKEFKQRKQSKVVPNRGQEVVSLDLPQTQSYRQSEPESGKKRK